MEKIELENVSQSADFDTWFAETQNSDFVSKILATHGFSQNLHTPFAQMVYFSAIASCTITEKEFPGIAKVSSLLRETRFYMPWPESAHNASLGEFKAERGFLVGAIDAILVWENRFYVLDWKSDRLPSFVPALPGSPPPPPP